MANIETFKQDYRDYFNNCDVRTYKLLEISLPLCFTNTHLLKEIFQKGMQKSWDILVWLDDHTELKKYSEILTFGDYGENHPVYVSSHTSTIYTTQYRYLKVYFWEYTLKRIYKELTAFLKELKNEGYPTQSEVYKNPEMGERFQYKLNKELKKHFKNMKK
jgi:hypothetical protein